MSYINISLFDLSIATIRCTPGNKNTIH